jgi:RHS repeat-associated protein
MSPEPRPVDLPNTMKYDSHNRLSEYTVTGSRKIALRYDPVSRVFRKEVYTGALLNTLESAVHYYYQGGEVVQEFDEMLEGEPESQTPIDEINWDYLRGYHGEVIRRREVDGETYTDMLQVVDYQGSVKQEASPDVSGTVGASNGYADHAEGEPLPIEQPSDIANHIQFHGGILEDSNIHTNPVTDGEMGYFYRMGVRHYSPGLHRFIQRDPLSYIRVPGRSTPLSLNPYIYGMNRPDQLSDVSGYQAGPGNVVPCSGCVGSGQVGGGFGTDGGHGPVVPPQGGNGGGSGGGPQPGSGDDKRTCLRSLPEDCFREDPAWQMCNVYLCCQWDDEPWWASCCSKTVITPGFCLFEDRDECLCGCCGNIYEFYEPRCVGFHCTKSKISIGIDGEGGSPNNVIPLVSFLAFTKETNILSLKDIINPMNAMVSAAAFMMFCMALGTYEIIVGGCNNIYMRCLCYWCNQFLDFAWPALRSLGIIAIVMALIPFFWPFYWIIAIAFAAIVGIARYFTYSDFEDCLRSYGRSTPTEWIRMIGRKIRDFFPPDGWGSWGPGNPGVNPGINPALPF